MIHRHIKPLGKPGLAPGFFARRTASLRFGDLQAWTYLATRGLEISVPICENAAAIWLGCVSMKRLDDPPAQ